MSKTVRIYEDGYIPTSLYSAMWGGLFPDLSTYVTQAHLDAGNGGEVIYPNGSMSLANISVYPEQVAWGFNVQVQQISSNNVFVEQPWLSNSTSWYEGPSYSGFNFSTTNASLGGCCITLMGHHSHVDVKSTGLPVLLTAQTQNGTPVTAGATGGHTFKDGSLFQNSPRGGVVTNGTKVTDVKINSLIASNCGSVGGSAAIQGFSMAGWQLDRLKIFSCTGALIRSINGSEELSITNSDLDWNGGDPYGIDIKVGNSFPGFRFVANNPRVMATVPSLTPYTMLSVSGRHDVFVNHVANSYYANPTAGSNIVAGVISGSPITGAKAGNTYNGFSGVQIGNLETALTLV